VSHVVILVTCPGKHPVVSNWNPPSDLNREDVVCPLRGDIGKDGSDVVDSGVCLPRLPQGGVDGIDGQTR
jgi:hypothetical protein